MTSSTKTVVLILSIVGGAGVLAIIAAIVFYLNCEECQDALNIAGEGASMMIEASKAPGTQQMRELGCANAMVMDMDRFMGKIADTLDDGARDSQFNQELREALQADTHEQGLIVSCEVSSFKPLNGPQCADVMRAYVTGAGEQAADTAHVVVMGSFATTAFCEGIYDRAGNFIREVTIDERL